ncbi:hypothetical protein SAMN05216225_10784 [Ornithinibacillus halophilus]|uniref:Uncharacterized protein n=1 Tax=Ornithinibacillus halophilus TaxID=930117 RepID=A0A1M5NF59_9BACI|nr:hypothetical protein SAMN05216225_10784 [Ornithinibacillus halophilus]
MPLHRAMSTLGAKPDFSRPSLTTGVDVDLSYEGEGSLASRRRSELDIFAKILSYSKKD